MNHLPLQVVASGCPVVVVNGLVAVYSDEVLAGVSSQLAVEVIGRDHSLLVLGEATGRLLHDGIDLGHHLVKGLLIHLQGVLLYLVYLGKDVGTLIQRGAFDGGLQLLHLFFLCRSRCLHIFTYFLRTGTQTVVVQGLNLWRFGLYFLHKGLNLLHVARRFVAEQCFQNTIKIHFI